MHGLDAVSETALITLRARVLESEMAKPVLEDPIGAECLKRLRALLPEETRKRILERRLPAVVTRHIALRSRKYDVYARRFTEENPDGLVVSLGCGFDTRYWRVSDEAWSYMEIDLPEVIEVKKRVLGDSASYPMMGSSVLDEEWVGKVQSAHKEKVLFLAEGLLMYLPKEGVMRLFSALSQAFCRSQIVCEVANERYTKGIWRKIVERKLRRSLGTRAGCSFSFGVRDAKDLESYGENIRVVEEWSYLEDEDITPKFLRMFRNVRFLSRTQWTVKAAIG